MNTVDRRNLLLILAGFVFYGWWDIRFLGLLLLTALTDYVVSKQIGKTEEQRKRKRWLMLSVFTNLLVLGFFKYFNFFSASLSEGLGRFGVHVDFFTLQIILPVGLSFYTFQALSYTIDVYKRRIAPASDLTTYLAFISFFPQLVSGPIERAGRMIPQFAQLHLFSPAMAASGLRLMLWGYFKKCVVADNLSVISDAVFDVKNHPGVFGVLVGTVAFSIQIYGDFSGYSDIAKGCARLFGFEISTNFKFPYFADSMREFWKRWHISLSEWFRDYVYIPLGGGRKNLRRSNLNLLITFVISGLWHGANWTYIYWGFSHGTFLVTESTLRKKTSIKIPKIIRHLLVITCSWFSYIYLRSPSLPVAHARFAALFTTAFDVHELAPFLTGYWTSPVFILLMLASCAFLFIGDLFLMKGKVNWFMTKPVWFRYTTYILFFGILLTLGVFQQPPSFIYFQF